MASSVGPVLAGRPVIGRLARARQEHAQPRPAGRQRRPRRRVGARRTAQQRIWIAGTSLCRLALVFLPGRCSPATAVRLRPTSTAPRCRPRLRLRTSPAAAALAAFQGIFFAADLCWSGRTVRSLALRWPGRDARSVSLSSRVLELAVVGFGR